MSRNGSGTYTLPAGNPVVAGTTITSTWGNNTMNDLAAALTDSVAADGQTPMTGDLNLNNNDIKNIANGTSAAPSISPTSDANTGIFFPAADTIAFTEGGVESMRIDASGNVGINTSSPNEKLSVVGNVSSTAWIGRANGSAPSADAAIYRAADNTLAFSTSSTERMRIDSSGNLLVNCNADPDATTSGIRLLNPATGASRFSVGNTSASTNMINFYNSNGVVGTINTNGTATAYITSSDYRLKENIAPMTGALVTISQLKPVTYDWKNGGSSQGFIAHELQAVVPECVVGEKDDLEEDGSIKPQGIDTSFLVATLTAAIQELKATVDAQAARIAALEA